MSRALKLAAAFGYDRSAIERLDRDAKDELVRAANGGLVPVAMSAAATAEAAHVIGAAWHFAIPAGVAVGLLVFNLLRCLNAGAGYGVHLEPAQLDKWWPGPVPLLLLVLLGGLFAQPLLLFAFDARIAPELQAEKERLLELHVRSVTSLLATQKARADSDLATALGRRDAMAKQLGKLDADLAELKAAKSADGTKALLEQTAKNREALLASQAAVVKEAAALEARSATLKQELDGLAASERAQWLAKLSGSGFFGLRLGMLWKRPAATGLYSWMLALLFALPALGRIRRLGALRKYERILHERQRAQIVRAHADAQARADALLRRYASYEGPRPSPFADAPFDTELLLLGRVKGVVRRPGGAKVEPGGGR